MSWRNGTAADPACRARVPDGDRYHEEVDDSETRAVIAESEALIHIEGTLRSWFCSDEDPVLLGGPWGRSRG